MVFVGFLSVRCGLLARPCCVMCWHELVHAAHATPVSFQYQFKGATDQLSLHLGNVFSFVTLLRAS